MLVVDDGGRLWSVGGRRQVEVALPRPASWTTLPCWQHFDAGFFFHPGLTIAVVLRAVPEHQLVMLTVGHGLDGPFGQVAVSGKFIQGRPKLLFNLRSISIRTDS